MWISEFFLVEDHRNICEYAHWYISGRGGAWFQSQLNIRLDFGQKGRVSSRNAHCERQGQFEISTRYIITLRTWNAHRNRCNKCACVCERNFPGNYIKFFSTTLSADRVLTIVLKYAEHFCRVLVSHELLTVQVSTD